MKNVINFIIIIIVFFTGFSIKLAFAEGRDMSMLTNLKAIESSKTWKQIWCDGYSIYIYSLPFYKDKRKLFEVENRKFMQIGTRILSPDNKKIVFDLKVYKNLYYTGLISQDLYLIDTDGTNLRKLKVDLSKNIFLITFLGNDKLLFNDYGINKAQHLYALDLNTGTTEILYELGENPIGRGEVTASYTGDLLLYGTRDGFVVYNIKNKMSRKIHIEGDYPILSPDGQRILFRRGGMTGSYYIVNIDDLSEKLVLSESKIRSLLSNSGSYRDLQFFSWSPNNQFILFLESSDLQKGKMFALDVGTKEIVEIQRK